MDVTDMKNGRTAQVGPREQTPTGDALQVQIGPGDPISNIPVVILFEHHQVHEGETHRAQFVNAALGTGTVKFGVTVPANTYPHMIFGADVYDGAVKVEVREAATFTGTTAVAAVNRNRNTPLVAPGTTVKSGVTSTDGTLIDTFFAGASSKASATSRSASEWILKAGTIYSVTVVGLVANTQVVVGFDWYEDLGV